MLKSIIFALLGGLSNAIAFLVLLPSAVARLYTAVVLENVKEIWQWGKSSASLTNIEFFNMVIRGLKIATGLGASALFFLPATLIMSVFAIAAIVVGPVVGFIYGLYQGFTRGRVKSSGGIGNFLSKALEVITSFSETGEKLKLNSLHFLVGAGLVLVGAVLGAVLAPFTSLIALPAVAMFVVHTLTSYSSVAVVATLITLVIACVGNAISEANTDREIINEKGEKVTIHQSVIGEYFSHFGVDDDTQKFVEYTEEANQYKNKVIAAGTTVVGAINGQSNHQVTHS